MPLRLFPEIVFGFILLAPITGRTRMGSVPCNGRSR